jgi:uncharacterized protein
VTRLEVECPRCGARVAADEREPLPAGFPFCSERCRLLDLGKWFDEEFRVSRAAEERDLDQSD